MKKSKCIQLVLITAALASCNRPNRDWESGNKVYLRGDSTAPYSRSHLVGSALLWYYAFRPYGSYRNGHYERAGFYSGALNRRSNFGSNPFKSAVARGGFGRGGFSVSS